MTFEAHMYVQFTLTEVRNRPRLSLKGAICNTCSYMASPVSGQDEPTHTLWLATRAGKMELSCPLRTNHSVLREKFPQKSNTCTVIQNCKSFISQAFSVKMAGYWPCSSLFCEFMDLDSVLVHEHAKKNLANVQPSWPKTLGQEPIFMAEYSWF